MQLEEAEMSRFSNYAAFANLSFSKNLLVVKEFPSLEAFNYYRRIGQLQKAKQIQEDLLDLWKHNPEDGIKIVIQTFISRAGDISSVFSSMFANFQRFCLPHLDPRKIISYYSFARELGTMYASDVT